MLDLDWKKIKEYLYLLPLALIAAVTPLIVHYKKIKLGEVVASYWIRDYNTDFFSYYKMLFFVGALLLAILAFYIYHKKEKTLKNTFYYIPLTIYLVMIIASTIFSEAKLTSLNGFPDRYEGMAVLIGYILVVIFTINLVKKKKHLKFLFTFLLISAVIIGVLGIYQFFGLDFFQSQLGKRLILSPTNFENIADGLDFRFDGNNIIYATFYNPNYAGSYFAMLFMLTFIIYFFAEGRQNKILFGAINLLIFANWLGSLSRAGILGVIFSGLIMIFLLKDQILKRWRSLVIIFIGFILVFTAMDLSTGGSLRQEFFSLGVETELALKGEKAEIKDIAYRDKRLIFETEENNLEIYFTEADQLKFTDGNKNNLSYYSGKEDLNGEEISYIYLADQAYDRFKFRLIKNKKEENMIFELYYNDNRLNMLVDSARNLWAIGMRGNLYPIKEVESWGFEGKESLASGRGYIWSRSLPLLKETMITGYGPDSYAIYFPQDDVIGKFKTFRNTAKIVDKPHNMYLQLAVNTGLISLLAVISLFIVYFWRNIKFFWNSDYKNWYERAGVGVFSSFLAYVVAGFFNDSVISVAPVFWLLLGMGIMIEIELRGNKSIKK